MLAEQPRDDKYTNHKRVHAALDQKRISTSESIIQIVLRSRPHPRMRSHTQSTNAISLGQLDPSGFHLWPNESISPSTRTIQSSTFSQTYHPRHSSTGIRHHHPCTHPQDHNSPTISCTLKADAPAQPKKPTSTPSLARRPARPLTPPAQGEISAHTAP